MIAGGLPLIYRNSFTKTSYFSSIKPQKEKRKPPQKDSPPSEKPDNPPHSPPDQEENPTLERSKRVKELLAQGNEFLLKTNPRLVPIPDDFIGELLEKGYNHASDIRKLFDWGLTVRDIPDLNSAKRIGVIKFLTVERDENKSEEELEGFCSDLVIIARETLTNQNGSIINLDGRVLPDGPEFPYVQEIITSTLAQETDNPNKWEVAYLYANGSSYWYEGKSAGVAVYLALLSAIHKKPLPKTAASGVLEISEQKVLKVGGIIGKIEAAFKSGVENLVFPRGNFNIKGGDIGKFFPARNKAFPDQEVMHYLVENFQDLKEAFAALTSQ